MNYFLFEESGDSEADHFDPGRSKAVVDDDDAESCCSDSFEPVRTEDDGRAYPGGRKIKNRRIRSARLSSLDRYDAGEEADSSGVVNVIDDDRTGGAKSKLKNSVSESFSIGSGVTNMDDITDDRLFWEACLAHGYT
uniref:Uncharacterized protein n=1 Tax=Kalanchoe fedtschenkoi TaxID=63787 RepID=A0A7N1A1X3_KALFE